MDFLPKNYEAPKSEGNYMKLKKGANPIRILGPAITGFEYWNAANKPVRSPEGWDMAPLDMREGERVKHFWAFPVWNYEVEKVQILQLTQKSIQGAIQAYVDNKKWGDPTKYDLVITRVGDGLETEYTTIAEPHSEAPKADISGINLNALFKGEDPFTSKTDAGVQYPTEDIKPEDIPF